LEVIARGLLCMFAFTGTAAAAAYTAAAAAAASHLVKS